MIEKLGNFELPKTLYKYRDWESKFHRDLLTKQTAYFASPSSFNDPFDCKIPIRYDIDSDVFLEEIYFNLFRSTAQKMDDKTIREHAKKYVANGLIDPKQFKKNDAKYFENLNKRMGVFSLSKHNSDVLMWGHYAKGHTGFCVGFESSELLLTNNIGYIGKVDYYEEYPTIIPKHGSPSQFKQQIFSKWDKWSYEDEYRLTKNHIENRKIPIPKSVFSEVIFGCNMSIINRNKLMRLTSKHLPHVKFLEAIPSEDSFKIEINEIS